MKRRLIHIVLTPHRAFTFGSGELAARFARRAARVPSMAGQKVELLNAPLVAGRRRNIADNVRLANERLDAMLARIHPRDVPPAGGEAPCKI